MMLSNAPIGEKLIIKKVLNQKLRHLALQGAICLVLKKYKRFLVVEIWGRGKIAIDIYLCNYVEVEHE